MKNIFRMLVLVLLSLSIITEGILSQESNIKGDRDSDGIVSDFELLEYIDEYWLVDLVTNQDLLEVIDNWGGNSSAGAQITVSRDMPIQIPRGGYFNISLLIDVNESNKPKGAIIEEYVPVGWSISCSNSTWSYTCIIKNESKLTLLLYPNILYNGASISYKLLIPANATGNATFSGTVEIRNKTTNVLGDTKVMVSTYAVTANRTLPDKANAGSRVNITIALDINETSRPNSVIVKDYFPMGWNVSSSEPGANSINSTTGEIKWILFGESVSDRIISYVLEIPPGVLGNNTFSGEVIYLDQWNSTISGDITGDSVIDVEKECLVKGDANCDDEVSDFEILDYVNKWVKGTVSDFDLLEAIENWAKG